MRTRPAGEARAQDLQDSVRALWPGYGSTRDRAARGERYLLLPSAERPTLMVPRQPRAATAAALRNYKVSGDRRTQAALQVLGGMARTGVLEVLPLRLTLTPPKAPGAADAVVCDSIRSHLRTALAEDGLVVALHTSKPRANRKPVLQVLSPEGATTGFAKVGTNELTRALVATEAAALRYLATLGLRRVTAPTLQHSGVWHDHQVLVQSPFLRPSDDSLSPADLAAAMVEVALIGRSAALPAEDAPYIGYLRDRVSGLPVTPAAGVLSRSLSTLAESGALRTPLRFGHWHGDWTPWNMSAHRGRALVWDWERFEAEVPLGFDALHYDVQGAIVRRGRQAREAVTDMMDRSASLLRPFDIAAEHAMLYAVLYLVEIGTRYLHDRQEEAGSERGKLESWLLPELEARVRRIAVESR